MHHPQPRPAAALPRPLSETVKDSEQASELAVKCQRIIITKALGARLSPLSRPAAALPWWVSVWRLLAVNLLRASPAVLAVSHSILRCRRSSLLPSPLSLTPSLPLLVVTCFVMFFLTVQVVTAAAAAAAETATETGGAASLAAAAAAAVAAVTPPHCSVGANVHRPSSTATPDQLWWPVGTQCGSDRDRAPPQNKTHTPPVLKRSVHSRRLPSQQPAFLQTPVLVHLSTLRFVDDDD